MGSERFEMRVSAEWLARVDELRGGEPRASFVKRVLEQYAAGMMEPQVVVPPSSPMERAEMEKVLDGAEVRVEAGSVLPEPEHVPMHMRSFNGHRPGCGCIKCHDVRTGRRKDAGEV